MREIKFRAWHKSSKKMYQVLGLHNGGDTGTIWRSGVVPCAVLFKGDSDAVLMQSTGLHDKNGKEIYEGDILDYGYYNNKPKLGRCLHKVVWDNASACWATCSLKNDGHTCDQIDPFAEVIGNIYENPELLEKGGK